MRRVFRIGTALLGLMVAVGVRGASAHEVRPGYLAMTEVAPGRYQVVFKVPMRGSARLRMVAVLPAASISKHCSAVSLVPIASNE